MSNRGQQGNRQAAPLPRAHTTAVATRWQFVPAHLVAPPNAGLFLLAAAQQPYAAHRPTFMLFGDSLTEFGTGYHWKYTTDKKGWTALLSEAYSRKVCSQQG